jgi:uncharacterized membrane protein YgcG
MSAQQGAPALGRAQVATPTLWNAPQGSSIPRGSAPARMTRRAMAVAAATLCAPLVAMLGLAAIGAAGGGNQAEMGTLAGTQGLRGSTVATTSPAPTQVSAPPADELKARADGTNATAADPKQHPTQSTASQPQREPAPDTRAPAHKPPTRTVPERPPSRVNPHPSAPAPPPAVDPTGPGAPIPGSSGGTSGGAGSTDGSGSTSGSSSGSGSSVTYPEGPDGQSGGD